MIIIKICKGSYSREMYKCWIKKDNTIKYFYRNEEVEYLLNEETDKEENLPKVAFCEKLFKGFIEEIDWSNEKKDEYGNIEKAFVLFKG